MIRAFLICFLLSNQGAVGEEEPAELVTVSRGFAFSGVHVVERVARLRESTKTPVSEFRKYLENNRWKNQQKGAPLLAVAGVFVFHQKDPARCWLVSLFDNGETFSIQTGILKGRKFYIDKDSLRNTTNRKLAGILSEQLRANSAEGWKRSHHYRRG